MSGYSLIFRNNSTGIRTVCIYQKPPNAGTQELMPLAWLAQKAAATTTIQFNWTITYDFVWSDTGPLAPGVMTTMSQTWLANPTDRNRVTFTHKNGLFTFTGKTAGASHGSYYLEQDGTIPGKTAAVGLAMGGAGTWLVSAEPNMEAVFTPDPNPSYWITFGEYTQGEVISLKAVHDPAHIIYPSNVTSMTAILNADNTWTILQTAEVNAALVARREQNPRAIWGA